ncbi:DUF1801 domain-containing protein [Roseateles sp. DC23W]|uniref:DUF1801 domain-containing protein n=1 Tax=Pelomonas dachongensis TaxID=3299029 RepID=A0ABW7EM98_9BURK
MPQLTAADTREAVDRFMTTLSHPHKAGIETLRQAMAALQPHVAEGIKWNAPSWRTANGYFATTHLRDKDGFSLILHLGAKAREVPEGGLAIDDPGCLLKWLGKDRAQVQFAGAADVSAKLPALRRVLAQWMRCV